MRDMQELWMECLYNSIEMENKMVSTNKEKVYAETFWTIADIKSIREELGYNYEHEWDENTYKDFLYAVEKDLVTVMRSNGKAFLTSLLKEAHFYDVNRPIARES